MSNFQLPPQNPTYFNKAQVSSGIIKPTPGRLRSIGGLNLSAIPYYLLLFDSANGDTSGDPFRIYPLYPNNGWTIVDHSFWGDYGLYFSRGITWAASSTALVLTAVSASSCAFEAVFE